MDYYIDIEVLPDPEFLETTLMNALFAKLHRALVQVSYGEIGVSFPDVAKNLGSVLRVHGTEAALSRLSELNWLQGLRDYTAVSAPQKVSATAQHRVVRRVQAKSNVARLRRRSVKKGWLTEEEAIAKIPLTNEKTLRLPYLQLKSGSTQQAFRLFVEHGPLLDRPIVGEFSAYGLSNTATVPWF